MSAPALIPVPQKSLTLFQIAEEVAMLLDCAETVTPAQQDEYRRDLAEAMTRQTTKIDRVHGFIKHCKANAAAAAEEIKRLQGVKKQYENAEDRMRDAVRFVLENAVLPDAKGARALKSPLVTFSLRGNAAKVEIRNEELVPSCFKTITVTLPVDTWADLLYTLGRVDDARAPRLSALLGEAEVTASIAVNQKAVQSAIESAVREAEESGGVSPEDLAERLAEARSSVPGAYLPEKGANSVVIR